MQVVDTDRSESSPQRRKTAQGHLLHCCCICGTVAPWSDSWKAYYSYRELDDGVPIPKFCSDACTQKGGARARNVTVEMKTVAKGKEMREPNIVYREATEIEKYREAVRQQKGQTEHGTR